MSPQRGGAPELTLEVETEDGVFLRLIRPATALASGREVGAAAEEATRSAAAIYGLPDFLFHPTQRSLGSGTREVGDAIVVVGDVAAAVQVKAREAPTGREERERAWLDRRISKAARQAIGTIRTVTTVATMLMNERGRRIEIDGSAKSWVPVVVVDHPDPPSGYSPSLSGSVPVVVLLRRDWEFLFEQLKSTDAVIRYLHRVRRMPPVALGEEPVRYYELAAADTASPPRAHRRETATARSISCLDPYPASGASGGR